MRRAAAALFAALAITVLGATATHDHATNVVTDAGPTTTTVVVVTTSTTAAPSTTTTSTTAAPRVVVRGDVWDALARCESSGRKTPSSPALEVNWDDAREHYEGGLHFTTGTWQAYELPGFPPHAYDATREQQIEVAIRVRDGVPGSSNPYLNAQGWAAWPSCSRTIGVRQ